MRKKTWVNDWWEFSKTWPKNNHFTPFFSRVNWLRRSRIWRPKAFLTFIYWVLELKFRFFEGVSIYWGLLCRKWTKCCSNQPFSQLQLKNMLNLVRSRVVFFPKLNFRSISPEAPPPPPNSIAITILQIYLKNRAQKAFQIFLTESIVGETT
jgi:hypothetical protein